MIYSRFGCQVEITHYCGKHKVPGLANESRMVRAMRIEDGSISHYLAVHLRADSGVFEVDSAIDKAPRLALAGDELKAAIEQAM